MSGGTLLMLDSGSNAFTPVQNTHSSPDTIETIPVGATTATIELWGQTGAGGLVVIVAGEPSTPGGGGSGSYVRTVMSVAGKGGKTFILSLGSGGSSSNSTITAGTVTGFSAMTAGGGFTGGNQGGGGAGGNVQTGGTQANIAGNAGADGYTSGLGGAAVVGVYASGNRGGNGGTGTNRLGKTAVAAFHYE